MHVTAPGFDGWLWGNPYAEKDQAVIFCNNPVRRLFVEAPTGRIYDRTFQDVGTVSALELVPKRQEPAHVAD